jgi:hypothetical protein
MVVLDLIVRTAPFGGLGLGIKIALGLAACVAACMLVNRRIDKEVAAWYKPGEPLPKSDFPAHENGVYPEREMSNDLSCLGILGSFTGLGLGLGSYSSALRELAGAFTGLASALVLIALFFVTVRPHFYEAGCSSSR